MNGNEKYIEVIKWVDRLHDYINKHFFENALSKPVITVSADVRNRAYGWFVRKKIWIDNDEKYTEINISSNYLNRSVVEIAQTMLHEMCHQYAFENNIQDCSRSGTYHNKLFEKIAQNHGLNVTKEPTIGYARTSFTEKSQEIMQKFLADEKFIYRENIFKGAKVNTSSTRKYICPCCEQSIRATKEVNIICADCNELMLEDK